jgi:hypothetical protein
MRTDSEIANGRRIQRSSGTLYWYGTGSNAVMETDLSNNMRYNYFFFGGQRVGRSDISNSVTWYFGDHLGSSRVVWSNRRHRQLRLLPLRRRTRHLLRHRQHLQIHRQRTRCGERPG